MYSDLIEFLLSVFHSFHDFSRSVMNVFSYSFEVAGSTVSVGAVMFGSLFLTFAIVQVSKWLVR